MYSSVVIAQWLRHSLDDSEVPFTQFFLIVFTYYGLVLARISLLILLLYKKLNKLLQKNNNMDVFHTDVTSP